MSEGRSYMTIRGEGEAEFEEKKSIFIGHAAPAQNEEEALAFLSRIRAEYPDAKHNVYAYRLRENGTTRYSDDREPQGTAGLPVLDVLRKSDIVDAVVVVTRYFGGTLLGTGGLVRAYTQAARDAVEAAGIVTRAELALLSLVCNYTDYQKIQTILQAPGIRVEDSDFAEQVTLSVALLTEECEGFCHRLTETCGGRIVIKDRGTRFDFL